MIKINLSPRYLAILIFVVALTGYVFFQARALILGPQVSIESPRDGEVVTEEVVSVSGQSRDIAWIELNGRQIFTDQDGFWEEKLLVSSGASIMTVKARNRFGRIDEESVLIYKR
jgi:hypothetical protein